MLHHQLTCGEHEGKVDCLARYDNTAARRSHTRESLNQSVLREEESIADAYSLQWTADTRVSSIT